VQVRHVRVVLDVPAEEFIRYIQLYVGWERHWDIVTSCHSSRSTSSHLRLKGSFLLIWHSFCARYWISPYQSNL